MIRYSKLLKEKFFKSAIVKDGCWDWKHCQFNTGYSLLSFRGKNYLAHRISLIVHGIDIPPKMCVDHICKNKKCSNPQHLRIVTRGQNVLNNSDGLAAKNAKKTHCLNGHKFDDGNLYFNEGRRHCRMCRYLYKIEWRRKRKSAGLPNI